MTRVIGPIESSVNKHVVYIDSENERYATLVEFAVISTGHHRVYIDADIQTYGYGPARVCNTSYFVTGMENAHTCNGTQTDIQIDTHTPAIYLISVIR